MTELLEAGRFTVADLDAMPDDGCRRELIDGMLFVSPAPRWEHQEVVVALAVFLRSICPRELRTIVSPFDVRTSGVDNVQPDVLVARFVDITSANLPVAPVLAAEVASPSTSLHDRNTKKAHYERVGVASYWLLDPRGAGTIEVHELDDAGAYRLVAGASGDEELTVTVPFPVTLVPARLLDGLRP